MGMGKGIQVVSEGNSEVVVGPRRDGNVEYFSRSVLDELPRAAERPHSQTLARGQPAFTPTAVEKT